MLTKDLLTSKKPPVTIMANRTIRDAMQLLVDHRIGSLVVIDDRGDPIGIITERDVFHLTFKHAGDIMDMKVSESMTTKLVIGLTSDDVDYIAQVMTQNRIRHIPILDERRKLCGLISIGDIVKAKLDLAEVHVRYLSEYITGRPRVKRGPTGEWS